MSKYRTYDDDPRDTLVHMEGDFLVYESPANIGRYYLVTNNMRVAQKNTTNETEADFSKWIVKWKKNARSQMDNLQNRANDLLNERDEILSALTGIKL